MSKFLTLAAQVDRIPHLDLRQRFDVARLQAELDSLDPAIFKPFTSSTRYEAMTAQAWQGFSLSAPEGSLHGDLRESYEPPPSIDWTPIVEQLPYFKTVIQAMGGEGRRAHVMRIQPQSHLVWHRHRFDSSPDRGQLRSNWYELIVHIPIRIHPQFSYTVIDVRAFQTIDFVTERMPLHEANYPAGQAWAFNSIHYHNVFNRSDEPRLTLMLLLDLRFKRTYEIVSQAVSQYTGPLLDPLDLLTAEAQFEKVTGAGA